MRPVVYICYLYANKLLIFNTPILLFVILENLSVKSQYKLVLLFGKFNKTSKIWTSVWFMISFKAA